MVSDTLKMIEAKMNAHLLYENVIFFLLEKFHHVVEFHVVFIYIS